MFQRPKPPAIEPVAPCQYGVPAASWVVWQGAAEGTGVDNGAGGGGGVTEDHATSASAVTRGAGEAAAGDGPVGLIVAAAPGMQAPTMTASRVSPSSRIAVIRRSTECGVGRATGVMSSRLLDVDAVRRRARTQAQRARG